MEDYSDVLSDQLDSNQKKKILVVTGEIKWEEWQLAVIPVLKNLLVISWKSYLLYNSENKK